MSNTKGKGRKRGRKGSKGRGEEREERKRRGRKGRKESIRKKDLTLHFSYSKLMERPIHIFSIFLPFVPFF